MKTKIITGIIVVASGAALALTACGSSGPAAQDVTACRMAVTALDKTSADPVDYAVAAGVAVSPDLRNALTGLGEGLSTLNVPGAMGAGSDTLANTSIRLAGAICTADGVAWPAGDS